MAKIGTHEIVITVDQTLLAEAMERARILVIDEATSNNFHTKRRTKLTLAWAEQWRDHFPRATDGKEEAGGEDE